MLAIDVEDTQIKILQVAEKRVEKSATISLEDGMVENGAILDKEGVSRRLSDTLENEHFTDKDAVTSINGVHAIYRIVSLPHIEKNLAKEAAAHELERAMPVSLDELYTSWQMIDVSDAETLLCMVGVPRTTVDSIISTLRLAGLQSRAMDIAPLAIARVADEKDAIILNVQPLSFDIVIMIDGIPQLLRSVLFSSLEMTSQDRAAMIKEELDRTVSFYNGTHTVNPVDAGTKTFISGETIEAPDQTLGYAIKPLPQWLDIPDDFKQSDYAISIGLAFKQIKDSKSTLRVNLDATPEIYLPKSRPIADMVPWIVGGIALVIIVPMMLLTQQAVTRSSALQSQLSQAEVQIGNVNTINSWTIEMQAQIDALKASDRVTQDTLSAVKAMRQKVNADLAQITSLLPATITLTSVSYAGDSTSINGSSPDKETVLGYTKSLRDSGRFPKVILANMREVERGKWLFTLQLQ